VGDEIILILGNLSNGTDACIVFESLLNKFRSAFVIEGRQLILTSSIGISVYPDDGQSSTDLLRCADTAMYQAKSLGRNTYSYFTHEMNKDISRRLAIEEQMRGALEREEFEVYYQAQYNLHTMEVIGAEALLRWNNPLLGNISPVEFIPIAEQTGLIVSIGEFVLLQALTFLGQWQTAQQSTLRMAVNLSPRQFRDPNLVNFIDEALKQSKTDTHCLELEITEGVLMSGHASINDALMELDRLGIILSMDDFGTGYSSLSYLREYPFKVLKIDRTFVNGLTQGVADKELVIATIAMAHALGLKVVAEGIETQEQLAILQSLKCDYAQGYLLAKPVQSKTLLENISSHNC
jgi:EAL domain-containing protein (putative c-di-GMP-specific phosphodiesterase class I)